MPQRGNLPEREPAALARWQAMDLFARVRASGEGRPLFMLHDGPPYANGHIHIGHALNKVLKDVINRSRQMTGYQTNYVPGWDCHGLPIEWQIEKKYRDAGKDKDDVPVLDFRDECARFAEHWIDIQREEFMRLGVMGDWDNYYTTMEPPHEAQILRELSHFLMSGELYRGARPVMWSVVEKTALAEAEIEYHDHTSTMIYVRFPLVETPDSRLAGAGIVIWTTTPWTIPANQASAYGPEIDYVVVKVTEPAEGSQVRDGERLVLARSLVDDVAAVLGFKPVLTDVSGTGEALLAGARYSHPLAEHGYPSSAPLLAGDFVEDGQGTGLVHMAPDHGPDDYELCSAHGIGVLESVKEDGRYSDTVPLFAGIHVFKADAPVMDALRATGALLHSAKFVHSYPHSWRSKAPIIYRTTPQWFISLSEKNLRETALQAIADTKFYPEMGRNRLRSMVQSRPDWCISRQRSWGIPIAIFVNRKTNEPLRDAHVMQRIIDAVETEGAGAWLSSPPERFLGPDYDPNDYEQVFDILDVWFESGSTHAFMLEPREDMVWPADLYLEGSDMHRGWFQLTLLESCGTRGRAPFKAILTHGFVLDVKGHKMSKSVGNVVAPQEVIKKYGADVLRLWVVSSTYNEDIRIGDDILQTTVDQYRRLRNTLRYLTGVLEGFTESERVPAEVMPELERWILNRLSAMDAVMRAGIDAYAFQSSYSALHSFCAIELSAFYFDIRKDSLYCDPADSLRRRAVRTVMHAVFERLTAWLAPVLCFTAEEAWLYGPDADPEGSVHLKQFPETPSHWRDGELEARWTRIRAARRVVTHALERARAEGHIGASLQAHPVVYSNDETLFDLIGTQEFADICITSGMTFERGSAPAGAMRLDDVAGVAVVVNRADGEKCARCWRVLPEVGQISDAPDLCGRCHDALSPASAS